MTLLLSLRKRALSGLADDGHPLRGGEENDHVRFLAYTFWLPCTCALDREKEIPPNTFLRLSKFDPAVEIRTRVLFSFFV